MTKFIFGVVFRKEDIIIQNINDIDKKLIEIEDKQKELIKEKYLLLIQKREIIQSNCKHEFICTDYYEYDEENNTFKDEMICVKCGLKSWKEY